ncbi:MAG: YfhO family protein [Lachnospiraceae bacterium]
MAENTSVKTAARRQVWIYMLVFAAAAVFVLFLEYRHGTIAGTNEDWINQHTAYADYFRKRFYRTHNFFPQFASELGGGQNIWYFAYYGLYNPLYLLSWFFPFISMETWFQIVGVLTQLADGILCFFWLRRHTGEKESFIGALMLMLSFAIVGQTISQVMFVEYMPFLLMMLIGADRRREKGSGVLMAVGTLCMILNSFYFAPACLAVLVLYILFINSEIFHQEKFGRYLLICIRQFVPALVGIALSAFYLGPIVYAVLGGRSSGSGSDVTGPADLFLPDLSVHRFLYSDYGLGLTVIALVMLCSWIFTRGCRERWLAIVLCILFIFPVFAWVLNGGLYARSKAYIPFLPLVCLLCARFLEWMGSGKMKWQSVLGGYCLTLLFVLKNRGKEMLVYDMLLCGLMLLLTYLLRQRAIAAASAVGAMVLMCIIQTANLMDTRVTAEAEQALHDTDTAGTIHSVLSEDDSMYRMEVRGSEEYENANENRVWETGQNLTTCYSSLSNQTYDDFRQSLGLARSARNVFMQDPQNDPLFLRFMGVKYLVGGSGVDGWSLISGSGQSALYENEQVSPVFYLTDQTMPQAQWDDLSWAEKQLALLEAAAVPDSEDAVQTPETEPVSVSVDEQDTDKGSVTAEEDTLHVKASKDMDTTLTWNEEPAGDYLFISFRVENHKEKDVRIDIGTESNLLSSSDARYYNNNEVFHYVIQVQEGTDSLDLTLGAGDYDIKDIECCSASVDEQASRDLYQSAADLQTAPDGDGYTGTVTAGSDQWLITTVPYEDNFRILIDGEEVQGQKVNGAFLGFQVPEGTHEVEIRYTAPGSRAGLAVTAVTLLAAAAACVRRRRKSRAEQI